MTYAELRALIARGDPAEMEQALLVLWGTVSFFQSATKPTRKPRAPRTEPVVTWLTPAQEAWESVMGLGSFSHGMAAKWLAPLREGYTDEQIGARLGYYLRSHKREGKMQYVSLKRFAETIGAYAPDELAFPEDA